MSYRERRRRKDSRAKTWEQLRAWRCLRCMQKIAHSEIERGRILGVGPFALIHFSCPPWPGES